MSSLREKLLELIPAFHRNEVSPAEAHQISDALESDPLFSVDAEREQMVVDAFMTLEAPAIPKGLISNSIRQAVGEEAFEGSWFSLDTLLVALGVGVLCALVGQYISSHLTLPRIGDILVSVARFAATDASSLMLFVWLFAALLAGGGLWVTYRVFRS